MHDRPTVDELLEAVADYLTGMVMPGTTGRMSFFARVGANAVNIVRREIALEEEHLAREWAGLDGLLGAETPPASLKDLRLALIERNRRLVTRIRFGEADQDPWRAQLMAHLRTTTLDKLAVTNPSLATEEARA